jgi:hypothetical protein
MFFVKNMQIIYLLAYCSYMMYNFSGNLVKVKKNWHAGSEVGVPGWMSAPVWILTQQDLCPQTTGSDLPGQEGLIKLKCWESATGHNLVSASAKFSICTIVGLNETLVEDKMRKLALTWHETYNCVFKGTVAWDGFQA